MAQVALSRRAFSLLSDSSPLLRQKKFLVGLNNSLEESVTTEKIPAFLLAVSQGDFHPSISHAYNLGPRLSRSKERAVAGIGAGSVAALGRLFPGTLNEAQIVCASNMDALRSHDQRADTSPINEPAKEMIPY